MQGISPYLISSFLLDGVYVELQGVFDLGLSYHLSDP